MLFIPSRLNTVSSVWLYYNNLLYFCRVKHAWSNCWKSSCPHYRVSCWNHVVPVSRCRNRRQTRPWRKNCHPWSWRHRDSLGVNIALPWTQKDHREWAVCCKACHCRKIGYEHLHLFIFLIFFRAPSIHPLYCSCLSIRADLNGVEVVTPAEAAADTSLSGDGEGSVDLLIDCCGVAAAVQPAIKWVKRGGTLLVFACAAQTQNIRSRTLQ